MDKHTGATFKIQTDRNAGKPSNVLAFQRSKGRFNLLLKLYEALYHTHPSSLSWAKWKPVVTVITVDSVADVMWGIATPENGG